MGLGKFFGKVFGGIGKGIWKGLRGIALNAKKAETVFDTVDDVVQYAMPIVQTVAMMTPTRSDDEIVKAALEFGYGDFSLSMFGRKEDALRAIARFALQKNIRAQFGADVLATKESILNSAVELAHALYKNAQ